MTPVVPKFARDPFATLPTELPEFVKPFPSDWHRLQIEWLIESVQTRWAERNDFHCDGHTPVYYAARPDRTAIAVVPDFYLRRDVERKERKCWASWNEGGRRPDLTIDIHYADTDREELKDKVRVYEKSFRVGEYFFFNKRSNDLFGFNRDRKYGLMTPGRDGRLWSDVFDAWLGTWSGEYRGIDSTWIRLFDHSNPDAK